jgi:hypothetical protein
MEIDQQNHWLKKLQSENKAEKSLEGLPVY